MPWDTKAFGKRRDLSSEIVDKSKNILSNDDEKKKLFNWYQIAADNMPLCDGILTSQKENIHWDVGLRKRYRLFLIVLVIIITSIIVVIVLAILGLNNISIGNLLYGLFGSFEFGIDLIEDKNEDEDE